MKKLLFSLVIGTAIVFSGCNDEDEITPASDYAAPDFSVTAESVVTTDAAVEDAVESVDYEVDLFSGTVDAIDNLSTDSGSDDQLKSGARDQYRDRYRLGEAPDINIDWNEGNFPKTITLDYGEETELANGRIISGLIEIVISAPMNTEGATRTVTFSNFSVDSLVINGTIVKEIVSVDDGRIVHIVRDLTITFPDGTEVEYYAELERTWTQGMGTPFYYGDDEMEISGYATCVDSDGNEYRREITQQLRKMGGCRYIVSGEVMYSVNSLTFGSVNYGDGNCDNLCQMTTAGGQKQVIIGKRVRERIANRIQNQEGQ
jgi:hypothetical protein